MLKQWLLSLAALFIFFSSIAQQGIYLEYRLSSSDNPNLGYMKAYALNGNSRSEMKFDIPALGKNSYPSIGLFYINKPNEINMLNPASKTYMVIPISPTNDNNTPPPVITVLGKETINGFNSTHLKVVDNSMVQEWWVTSDIQQYEKFMQIKASKQIGDDRYYKAMKAVGVTGMPCKIVSSQMGNKVTFELLKATETNLDPSLFVIPSDYTKTQSIIPGMQNFDYSKMQNMTPEEIKKYMEEQLKNASGY